MRILVTNQRLDRRAGSDLFVRDLARGLGPLGHFVFAYSSDLRERERLLERDSVSVATDLERLPFKPDVIHARHHLDAMSAILALPDVPAVYDHTQPGPAAEPPRHPRIYRYIVASEAEAHRAAESGRIDRALIEVVRIAVDTTRFTRVREPKDQAKRALVYDLRPAPGNSILDEVRTAVRSLNIDSDFVGRHLGLDIDNPESLLPGYDLVFAHGRSALEALACGCAVVILDETGCGEMVGAANFERLRRDNFAVPAGSPASAEHIRTQVERYSTSSWTVLTEACRRVSDHQSYLAQIEAIYAKAVQLHATSGYNLAGENRAVAEYLFALAPRILELDQTQRRGAEVTTTQAAMWLEISARIAAIQREFDKPGMF